MEVEFVELTGNSDLAGLKADAGTTEAKPVLKILFQPRFWGSYERRWEMGKYHLAPSIMRGWDTGDHMLCGLARGEEHERGEVKPGETLPGYICKKCRQVAIKRGYGKP
jgi:hypothetical protein